jgi:hypothetical protein
MVYKFIRFFGKLASTFDYSFLKNRDPFQWIWSFDQASTRVRCTLKVTRQSVFWFHVSAIENFFHLFSIGCW